ncbi:MAG TPA: lysophospholipid acyltransferase family protein [Spirochaetota bacterium]|nr:lysophospholipid acyltransferase family protein [Spirochaetota bacterium]
MAKSACLELVEFIPASFIMSCLRLVPLRWATRSGAAFGRLVWRLAPSQRRTAYSGLDLAYGDGMPVSEKKRIAKASFESMGKTIFEFMQFPKLSREAILARVRFVNLEAMDRALAQGRGVIAATAHLSNWEFFAAAFAATGRPLAAIVRPLDNRRLDRHVENLRSSKGVEVVPRGVALRLGLTALKKGKVLAFLMDQNAARHGVFVPFFGKPAATVSGPAAIALRLDVPIIFCYSRREDDGLFSLIFESVEPVRDRGDEERNIIATTALLTACIERAIRDRPEQWLWMHPRWRTGPEDACDAVSRRSAELGGWIQIRREENE